MKRCINDFFAYCTYPGEHPLKEVKVRNIDHKGAPISTDEQRPTCSFEPLGCKHHQPQPDRYLPIQEPAVNH